MINTIIMLVFIIGYALVVFEHKIRINKTATVLLMGVICWLLLMINGTSNGLPASETALHLSEHLQDIAQIVFFLMGAMTIVQLIDSHNGFKTVTDLITARHKIPLLWAISLITFFLSAAVGTLPMSIVMTSIMGRLVQKREDRLIFASLIIIASNAGGVWTPIGDITTTMLWIGERITTGRIITTLFIPSLLSLLVPLVYFSLTLKNEPLGEVSLAKTQQEPGAKSILFLGIGSLLFVPVFRSLTDLPPFMGMLFGLGIMWLLTDLMHHEKREHLKVPHVFTKIDFASIMFFLGILLAVAALESGGILRSLALWLDQYFKNKDLICTLLGLLSAIIDNVPLTAATMGMYDLVTYPTDSKIWELLAYAVGTGGSILIIGSAAGVVVMGMEKINFNWYLKKVSLPTAIGYFAGIIAYLIIYQILPH